MLFLDLTPLRRYRDYRLLYTGQFVSFLGSQLSYVALPYQVYKLTHSSLAVGMIGMAQLVPLVVFGLIGGAYADAVDRRRLLIVAELGMIALCLLLLGNACLEAPAVWPLYGLAALRSALAGFHRPALEATTPRLVPPEELPAVASLASLCGNVCMIGGPALAGVILDVTGTAGPAWVYALDAASYGISLVTLWLLRTPPRPADAEPASLRAVVEGLRYAASRQELLGTYVVDMVAMIFGMPMALFPAIADQLGGARVLGWLYAAPSIGALVMTLFSGWAGRIRRHGVAITISAGLWGVSIIGFGYARSAPLAILFLGLAGAADMVCLDLLLEFHVPLQQTGIGAIVTVGRLILIDHQHIFHRLSPSSGPPSAGTMPDLRPERRARKTDFDSEPNIFLGCQATGQRKEGTVATVPGDEGDADRGTIHEAGGESHLGEAREPRDAGEAQRPVTKTG